MDSSAWNAQLDDLIKNGFLRNDDGKFRTEIIYRDGKLDIKTLRDSLAVLLTSKQTETTTVSTKGDEIAISQRSESKKISQPGWLIWIIFILVVFYGLIEIWKAIRRKLPFP